jgi:transketolase
VFYPLVRGIDVVADRRTNSRQLAGRDRSADPGAADEHAALCVAAEDRFTELTRLVGVVDALGVGVGAEIDNVVSGKRFENRVSEMDASVVEGDRDFHRGTVPRMARVDVSELRELGQQFRVDSVRCAAAAKSGHPSSGMSAADLMAVLVANHLRYDFDDPKRAENDRLIFSKGHASTLLYAIFRAAGAITEEELLQYRQFDSMLEGHPTPLIPWVDVATGSLGQGLPYGVGMALAGKHLDRLPYRIWVLCGDSEMAEGSVWEAFEHAAHYELDNITAIIDVNRLGQRGETMVGWDLDVYRDRAHAFGWRTIEIDGHDVEEIDRAFTEAAGNGGKPAVVIARTIKGKGVKAVENQPGWHGKALDNPDEAIAELGGIRNIRVEVAKPEPAEPHKFPEGALELPRYDVGDEVATRKAYGDALAALGTARGDVVALDGEVSNSTFAEIFAKAHPERFFEMYIAEQQMLAAAVGLQARGWNAFASTFAAFLSRAYDFIRMAAISRVNLRLTGSHAGVSIGEDGPSQMALEDIAALRAIHSSTVLQPCDANQTAKLVTAMADTPGIVFLRTLRPNTPVIYDPDEEFRVGGSRVLRSSDDDEVTIVGSGITVHEALKAAESLEEEGISARVIDAYSIKPIDVETLQAAAEATGRIVTAEDHYPEGGLGEAVLAALAQNGDQARVVKLAVAEMPHSGKPAELLAAQGIDASGIAATARQLVAEAVTTS